MARLVLVEFRSVGVGESGGRIAPARRSIAAAVAGAAGGLRAMVRLSPAVFRFALLDERARPQTAQIWRKTAPPVLARALFAIFTSKARRKLLQTPAAFARFSGSACAFYRRRDGELARKPAWVPFRFKF